MSNNVRNPFVNVDSFNPAYGYQGQDAFLGDLLGSAGDVISLFKKKEATPEEQRAKAGVWYEMIETFLSDDNMTGNTLGQMYESRLPFSQKSTKKRFISDHLNGKARTYIIKHLIQKVNDELTKGGFKAVSEKDLLRTFGLVEDDVKKVVTSSRITLGSSTKGRLSTPSSQIKVPDKAEVLSGEPLPKVQPKVTSKTTSKDVIKDVKLPLPTSKKAPVNTSYDPAFDRVKPLAPTMKMSLKAKGVTPSSNIEVLTNQFYNEIVRKDQPNNFSGQNTLEEIQLFDYSRDYADEAVDAMITAVISYIKALRTKKASGEELSEVQKIIVTGTERAEDKIKEAAKTEAANKVGSEILFGGKWVWIVGGVVGVIIIIALIMRRK